MILLHHGEDATEATQRRGLLLAKPRLSLAASCFLLSRHARQECVLRG